MEQDLEILGSSNNTVTRWGSRFIFSFSDQLVFSLSNFVLNIVLARWMPADTYGAYALGFSLFLFFVSIPSALIWEPMAVLGVTKQPSEHAGFFQKLLIFQSAIVTAIALLLVMSSFFIQGEAAVAVRSVAIAMPFLVLIWFFRQICYFRTAPDDAFKVSLIYFIFQMGGITALFFLQRLSIQNVFVWTAFSSLIAFVLGWKSFGLLSRIHFRRSDLLEREMIRAHWAYGKWILGSGLAYGVATLSVIPLLSLFSSLDQVAAFKAMQNFIQPIYQALAAITLVMLPIASKQAQLSGGVIPKKKIWLVLVVVFIVSSLYLLILVMWGEEFIRIIYKRAYYQDFGWLLIFLGSGMVVHSVGQVFRILLRAVQQPKAIFWSKVFPALFVVVIGLFLIFKLGVLGAAITTIVSIVVEVVILIYHYFTYLLHTDDKDTSHQHSTILV